MAQEALEKAIQLKPDHALAHFRLRHRLPGSWATQEEAQKPLLQKAKGLERAKP